MHKYACIISLLPKIILQLWRDLNISSTVLAVFQVIHTHTHRGGEIKRGSLFLSLSAVLPSPLLSHTLQSVFDRKLARLIRSHRVIDSRPARPRRFCAHGWVCCESENQHRSGVETGRGGEEGRKERIVRETRWPGVEREEKGEQRGVRRERTKTKTTKKKKVKERTAGGWAGGRRGGDWMCIYV